MRQTHAPAYGMRPEDGRTDDRRVRLSALEVLALVIVVLAVVAAAVLPALLDEAEAPQDTRSVKVTSSDTVWDIASANPVEGFSTAETVALILDLNGLQDGHIVAGQLLVVPASPQEVAVLASN